MLKFEYKLEGVREMKAIVCEMCGSNDVVKQDFAYQLYIFLQRDIAFTHEVSCNQHEAVYPGFPPCTKKKKKKLLALNGVLYIVSSTPLFTTKW